MPNHSLKALCVELALFACTCHSAVARRAGKEPPRGGTSHPLPPAVFRFHKKRKGTGRQGRWEEGGGGQREKGKRRRDNIKAKDKGKI